MRNALYGFRSIAFKEFLHIQRDPTTLIFALLTPLLELVLFGFAINFDVRHVKAIVVDQDHSRESRRYLASLRSTQYLDLTLTAQSADEAERALRSGTARAAVIIPPDFSRTVRAGHLPVVHALVDGSDSQVANPAQQALRQPARATQPTSSDLPPAVETRTTVLFNPAMRTQVYTLPGLVGVILQLVTVTLTSFSLVREREQGSLEQLMVSPVGRLGLMLGKLVPYAGLAILELLVVLFLTDVVFGVHIAGSFLLLFTLSIPFILAALSLGLLISTLAANQAQALQMSILTLLPSILLSGYIAPRETLPGFLFLLSDVFPVTHFIQIARGIMVRGAGLADLVPSVIALIILTALLLALSTTRFRKSIE